MKIISKIIFLSIIVLFSPSHSHAEEEQINMNIESMMAEIEEYVKNENKEVSPWVTEVVKKHIPIGADKEVILDKLRTAGFDVKDSTNRKHNKKWLKEYDMIFLCEISFRVFPSFSFFWGHNLVTTLYFKDGKLGNIRARALSRAPIMP